MMTFKEYLLAEKVNDDLFWKGYEKRKTILDGKYVLVAKAGWIKLSNENKYKSHQFRIEVHTRPGGSMVGWVNFFENNDKLEALDLVVNEKHRRQGIATEMYKFARELGNDIQRSSKQTSLGKKFWSQKDHSA